MSFRKVPDLVSVDGVWSLNPFIPSDASSRWPEYEGKMGFVYIFKCEQYLKIGMSNSYENRLVAIQNACPFPVELAAAIKVPLSGMGLAEGYLHCKFVDKRHKGEWFRLSFTEVEQELETASRYAETYDRLCEEFYFRDKARRGSPEYQAEIRRQHFVTLKSAKAAARLRLEDIESDILAYHPSLADEAS